MHCIFLISLLVIQYSPANIVGSFNELLVLLLICKSLCIKASTKCIFLVGISEKNRIQTGNGVRIRRPLFTL